MKAKFGLIFIALGLALLLGSLGLFLYNEKLQNDAAKASEELMPQIVDAIKIRQEETEEPEIVAPDEKKMTVIEIDGSDYLGFVGIPAIGIELPVMADWDYEKLKTAPCRYSGSVYTEDLVIMAHNYKKHFGRLSQLVNGDQITFTDMDGKTYRYKVASVEMLPEYAVEEMTSGDFEFTLFTCTYTGESRVAVRCDRISE
ncbi:MAG: sortase [Oscillospiraceae bacterium]|nr:sortase [Oscillospiraceae bacterium]